MKIFNSLSEFYKSKEWQSFLEVLKLQRVNSEGLLICAHCGKPIIRKYDAIGHHIIELTPENVNDYEVSLNPANIKFVHHRCHNQIHNKLAYSGRQVFIVYGSPLSGKSSYVKEVAEAGDLIVDIDSIWQAVSGQDRYIKPNRLKSIVFSVRDNLLESVKYRRGKWVNAYVIGGYPFKGERERLADQLGAREIFIDTDKAECMSRLLACEDRDITEWTKYIDSWWKQFEGGY